MRGANRLASRELSALGLDLHSTLHDGPGFLLEARFLGALHLELAEQLGPEEARVVLLQLGFLHGVRDAAEMLRAGFGSQFALTCAGPTASRLPLHLVPRPEGPASGRLELAGSWPERLEAQAVLSAIGPTHDSACHVSAGYTSGWLSGLFDADVLAVEQRCAAAGHSHCRFTAREASLWNEHGRARAQLDLLPFQVLRDAVGRHLDAQPPPAAEQSDGFEPGAPIVHVWGPLMVIPFSGPEESLRALELIGRDPGASHVRVVIVDLSGTLIDDGFGAAALEQILDAIEGWGAEPILTGVSPLSAPVVAELERSHLVLHKDLPDAIATGFQIAEAQRRAS